jgi:hypothetical protein
MGLLEIALFVGAALVPVAVGVFLAARVTRNRDDLGARRSPAELEQRVRDLERQVERMAEQLRQIHGPR